jgi:hypothetical protein
LADCTGLASDPHSIAADRLQYHKTDRKTRRQTGQPDGQRGAMQANETNHQPKKHSQNTKRTAGGTTDSAIKQSHGREGTVGIVVEACRRVVFRRAKDSNQTIQALCIFRLTEIAVPDFGSGNLGQPRDAESRIVRLEHFSFTQQSSNWTESPQSAQWWGRLGGIGHLQGRVRVVWRWRERC